MSETVASNAARYNSKVPHRGPDAGSEAPTEPPERGPRIGEKLHRWAAWKAQEIANDPRLHDGARVLAEKIIADVLTFGVLRVFRSNAEYANRVGGCNERTIFNRIEKLKGAGHFQRVSDPKSKRRRFIIAPELVAWRDSGYREEFAPWNARPTGEPDPANKAEESSDSSGNNFRQDRKEFPAESEEVSGYQSGVLSDGREIKKDDDDKSIVSPSSELPETRYAHAREGLDGRTDDDDDISIFFSSIVTTTASGDRTASDPACEVEPLPKATMTVVMSSGSSSSSTPLDPDRREREPLGQTSTSQATVSKKPQAQQVKATVEAPGSPQDGPVRANQPKSPSEGSRSATGHSGDANGRPRDRLAPELDPNEQFRREARRRLAEAVKANADRPPGCRMHEGSSFTPPRTESCPSSSSPVIVVESMPRSTRGA